MEPATIIAIIGLSITYITTLITIYVNMRVKLKELEIKIQNIDKDLNEFKKNTQTDFKEMIDRHTREYELIGQKLDIMLEKIYEMKK